jgi:hypothetical protein
MRLPPPTVGVWVASVGPDGWRTHDGTVGFPWPVEQPNSIDHC